MWGRAGTLVATAAIALGVQAAPAAAAPGTFTDHFLFTGAEQVFHVPAGVTALDVRAVGAAGERSDFGSVHGGRGAAASGVLPVAPGATLFVEVGDVGRCNGAGPPREIPTQPGSSRVFSGGGGGASDVRTVSAGDLCGAQPTASLASRLLIAGGGGGAAISVAGIGWWGGDAGAAGGDFAGWGQPGTATAGGAGGDLGPGWDEDKNGRDGTYGQGGLGGLDHFAAGGGGGGGLYGGGGGAACECFDSPDLLTNWHGFGGGGGSSLVPDGGSLELTSDPAGVTITYTVPPAPPAPSVPDLQASSDSGSSDADDVTNATAPAFSVTGRPGATIELLRDGSPVASQVAGEDGAVSLTDPAAPTGSLEYRARQTVDGLSGDASSPLTVSIDREAPTTSRPDLTTDSGASSTDDVTNDPTPSFSGSASEPGATTLLVDDAISASEPAATDAAYDLTATSLAPGPATVRAHTTDVAGNTGPLSAPLDIVVDTTAPETTITSGPGGETNDTTPTFGFASDEAGSTFECSVDGAPFAACTSPFTTAPLADGSHTFAVRATDRAGNRDASPATRAFRVRPTCSLVRVEGSVLGAPLRLCLFEVRT